MGTNATVTPTVETLKIQRTVFDLTAFDDVKLVKTIPAPTPVKSVEDALAACGNDVTALLAVINDGLKEKARDAAYEDISGFMVVDENGETTETPYTGTFADDKKSKLINLGVLGSAKMFAGGAWDSLSKEEKRAKKQMAVDMIRANPAMLASLQG
jgi:hypothetical protein